MKHLQILILCVICQHSFAQVPFFTEVILKPEFVDADVQTFYQDGRSIMWMGTRRGLIRHNGTKERIYKSESGMEYSVTAVFRDSRKVLWAGCDNGYLTYLENDYLNEHLSNRFNLVSSITQITEDLQGRLWISTYGKGLFCLKDDVLTNYNMASGLSSDEIYDIAISDRGDLLVAGDRGLNICRITLDGIEVRVVGIEEGLPDNVITDIYYEGGNNLYLGTNEGGVVLYNIQDHKVVYNAALDVTHINQLYVLDDKEIFIATDEGLYNYNIAVREFTRIHVDRLMEDKINAFIVDDESNLWISSGRNKLARGNLMFRSIDLQKSNAHALLILGDDLWLGDAQNLTLIKNFRYDNSSERLIYDDINISSITKDSLDQIWVGTLNEGVLVFNSAGKLLTRLTEADGLPDVGVLAIAVIENRVLVSTLSGVVQLQFSANGNLHLQNAQVLDDLDDNFIYSIHSDPSGKVWYGTDSEGLVVESKGRMRRFRSVRMSNDKDTLYREFGSIYSITSESSGNLWFSTSAQGLIRYDGTSFYRFPIIPFISQYPYTSVIADQSGLIIMVRQGGVDILEPGRDHVMYLDRELGIDNFEEQYLNSYSYDEQGYLWFLYDSKAYRFYPPGDTMKIHPSITLDKIYVDFKVIDEQEESIFAYNRNNIVFNYDGLWYTDPSKLTFRYMLEGYDQSWITSKDQQATYSGLPPGDYKFRVMACENETFSDEPQAIYEFSILSPFWARWWFIAGCIGLLLLLVRWYVRRRERSAGVRAELERERMASQLQSLKDQIDPHFLFNSFNTLLALIEEDPARAAEFTEKLSDFYRAILKYNDEDLITMEEELNCVGKYFSLLKGRFGDNIDLEMRTNGNDVLIAPFTLQLLVENAIKHNVVSEMHPLHIVVARENGFITVSNNLQPKSGDSQNSGYGLKNINARYNLLIGKDIQISKENAEFKVKIPVIKAD